MIFQGGNFADMIVGDSLASLQKIKEMGLKPRMCVTSPPYFGLRSYLDEDHPDKQHEIGNEKTPEEFIEKLRVIFRAVFEVLAEDGTLWLNMGDSYVSRGGQGPQMGPAQKGRSRQRETISKSNRMPRANGLKNKDLIGIPWMLAFALRADGWYLRKDIIWHKPNPMPESVTDRPTNSHEYIFLFSKREKYFYDAEAILEPCSPNTNARLGQDVQKQIGSLRANGGTRAERPMKAVGRKFDPCAGNKNNPSFDAAMAVMPLMRNKRSVWTVTPRPYKGAHFATFPPDLIEPCILAGSERDDIVLDPFGGSGTTAQVALKHGRNAILCDLNAKNADLMARRIDSAVTKE